MAAADPVPPPEEVALLDLSKAAPDAPPGKAAPDEHPQDPDATLPWDRCQHGARDRPEPKRRSSPEGGREDPEEAAPSLPPPEAEDEEPPGLPVVAAHVFVPIDPRCIERAPGGRRHQPAPRPGREEAEEEEEERAEKGGRGHVPPGARPQSPRQKHIFLPIDPPRYRDAPSLEGRAGKVRGSAPWCRCGEERGSGSLRALAAVAGALLFCPCLLYGAYAFLPFDAPPLPSAAARLLYALRCAAFATVPVVLGMMVVGISRLCSQALEPLAELHREVETHRLYVSQSTQLFVLYFFNLAVLATYLPQELLKLVPLLTGLFAISRLIFWLSYAFGSSFRAFGFSLTFLPLLAMLLWNLYCMLVLEPQNLLALAEPEPQDGPRERGAKLRLWG